MHGGTFRRHRYAERNLSVNNNINTITSENYSEDYAALSLLGASISGGFGLLVGTTYANTTHFACFYLNYLTDECASYIARCGGTGFAIGALVGLGFGIFRCYENRKNHQNNSTQAGVEDIRPRPQPLWGKPFYCEGC